MLIIRDNPLTVKLKKHVADIRSKTVVKSLVHLECFICSTIDFDLIFFKNFNSPCSVNLTPSDFIQSNPNCG